MRNLNVVMLNGRIGTDLELKETANKISVVDFRIANNRDFKDKNGNEVKKVNWINCRAYKGLAETICKYLSKGSKVSFSGELREDSWEDKETGENRYRTYVLVTELEFLDNRNSSKESENDNNNSNTTQEYNNVQYEPYDADDVF